MSENPTLLILDEHSTEEKAKPPVTIKVLAYIGLGWIAYSIFRKIQVFFLVEMPDAISIPLSYWISSFLSISYQLLLYIEMLRMRKIVWILLGLYILISIAFVATSSMPDTPLGILAFLYPFICSGVVLWYRGQFQKWL